MVKILSSNSGDAGSNPKIPHALQPIKAKNKQTKNSIVTGSIKALKNGPHRKNNLFKKMDT